MIHLNSVNVAGYVSKELTIKKSEKGKVSFIDFKIVSHDDYKNRDSEKIERAHWIVCRVWGKQAEAMFKYVQKGDKLTINGKLESYRFKGDDGKMINGMRVKVDFMDYPPKKSNESKTQTKKSEAKTQAKKPKTGKKSEAKTQGVDDGPPF